MKTQVKYIIYSLGLLFMSAISSCEESVPADLFAEPPHDIQFADGHGYVDLGLPSGLLWARCNMGAASPEGLGFYYSWGEVEVKKDSLSSSEGKNFIDISGNTTYDAARANWGGEWRMPTKTEFQELLDNCEFVQGVLNDVAGLWVTGKNDNTIFLPLSGYVSGKRCRGEEEVGRYWTSTPNEYDNYRAYYLSISDILSPRLDYGSRNYGFSVRPVITGKKRVSISCGNGGAVAFRKYSGTTICVEYCTELTVVATPKDGYSFVGWFIGDDETPVSTTLEYTFMADKDIALVAKFKERMFAYGYEYIDLGLSVKWATCNVGASTPEECGGYYAWGEIDEKNEYSWSTYKWCKGTSYTMTKYCTGSNYGTVDNKTSLDLEDDVARVKWGGSWRMPTLDEQKELCNNCIWTWTIQNGVNGCKVTSKTNGNSIFIPAAGHRNSTTFYSKGSSGDYWSSSLGGATNNAYYSRFYNGYSGYSYDGRYLGHCVRPVCE